MKSSLLSLATALTLFVSMAASAAPAFDHGDPRRMSASERARYEAAQLKAQRENERRVAAERARYEAAQRKLQQEKQRQIAQERARLEAQRRADQQKAAERARWEAQHRNDRPDRSYGYNHR